MRLAFVVNYVPYVRRIVLALMFLVALSASAQNWVPDEAVLSKLEVSVTQYHSRRPVAVASYARFYFGYTAENHRMIHGEYVLSRGSMSKPAGIYVVGSQKELPRIFDGGCSVINMIYDVEAGQIVSLECNGIV
jgi:hypothetical protein